VEKLTKHVEALIFASESGVSLDEIQEILQTGAPDSAEDPIRDLSLNTDLLEDILESIAKKYADSDSILELRHINNSYQFLTKPEYHPTINRLVSHRSKKKLSQAALETLAIVAYRQPVTKLEIEHIRGVNCDYTIQRLLEKDLISIQGKANSPGRPLLYGTSPLLMDYFGLKDISELPKLKEVASSENSIGEHSD